MSPIVFMICVGVGYVIAVLFAIYHKPRLHMWLMTLCMVSDFSLTCYLEITRGVCDHLFGEAVPFEGNRMLLFAGHIPVAIALYIFYILSIWSGVKARRQRHRWIGYVTLALYVGSFLTAPGCVVEVLINWL